MELLQALDRAIGLFALPPFRASMQLPYALTVLELLLTRAHPLLREELVALLRAMTVAVDPGWLFEQLFPQVLIKVRDGRPPQRPNEPKRGGAGMVRRKLADTLTFTFLLQPNPTPRWRT